MDVANGGVFCIITIWVYTAVESNNIWMRALECDYTCCDVLMIYDVLTLRPVFFGQRGIYFWEI